MDESRRKALEAAVSHGFRKNDFNSLANALLGECELRTEAQEIIQKQVTELSNSSTDDVAPLKEALAGDENGVLRIQTLYVG